MPRRTNNATTSLKTPPGVGISELLACAECGAVPTMKHDKSYAWLDNCNCGVMRGVMASHRHGGRKLVVIIWNRRQQANTKLTP
jgi:hypothetical protein